ncbi:MAG: ABC transporter permease, partial [Eubacterium sp.]|nr:ABC transporter permease [Eubacterium sp.]
MREISNMKMISILFKKEMKDIFRDRKSVIMMFFVPVIIYPLIFLVSFFIISSMQTGVSVQNYNIVLDGVPDDGIKKEILKIQADENENRLTYKVSFFDMEDFAAIAGARYGLDTGLMADKEVGIIGGADEPTAEFLLNEFGQTDLIKNAIADELIDAYVSFQDDKYSVYYNSSVTNSSNTVRIISDALSEVKKALVIKNIENEGLDANEILNPIETEENDTATSEQSLGFFLGTIIPFMMIMGLLSGVLSPAMDSTVGEKERGTLESLLMMPVSESQIITAKFFSVALIGLITTLLSVISMAGLGLYMLNLIEASGIEGFGGINTSQFLPAILIALPVLIVLSLFLTAITMCVTCFARSNKEAGNYTAPIMFVTMFTSYIGFIPNIEFDRTLAMVPVANVCLLIKNLLLFKVDPELILIVIGSMAVYTGLIILLLGRVYKTENILYDEGRNSMAILERRSNLKRGGVPTSGDGWFTVMVGFILLV